MRGRRSEKEDRGGRVRKKERKSEEDREEE